MDDNLAFYSLAEKLGKLDKCASSTIEETAWSPHPVGCEECCTCDIGKVTFKECNILANNVLHPYNDITTHCACVLHEKMAIYVFSFRFLFTTKCKVNFWCCVKIFVLQVFCQIRQDA